MKFADVMQILREEREKHERAKARELGGYNSLVANRRDKGHRVRSMFKTKGRRGR
jgi:hypothetical protein